MKRISTLLLILIVTLLSSRVDAKNYTVSGSKNPFSSNINDFVDLKVSIKNNTDKTIKMSYIILENTVTTVSGWNVQFCDLTDCHSSAFPSTRTENLNTGKTGIYSVGVTPNTTKGSGKMRIVVFEEGFVNEADTFSYTFSTSTSISSQNAIANLIKLFPSPTLDILNVDVSANQVYNYNVVNINGQSVKIGSIQANTSKIDVGNLPSGIYFLQLVDRQGIMSRNKFLKANR
ncbi:MAG: T9SS type A sorting domain-containing protein [Bacteroidota bacterium]|nr:T9SS type A sorting domain-containing protein [Bacteroidota bacterium]